MTRALLLLVLVVGACTPIVEPSPASPSIAISSPTRSPSPLAPTPMPITTPPVNPTANPFPSIPFFPVPTAVSADPAVGSVVFSDRAGSWRYDGARGVIATLLASASLVAVDRHIVMTRPLVAGFDAGLFDARTSSFLRVLPQETPKFDSLSVSADGRRVAYVTPQKSLRIAFQQQFGNVDGRALVRDRLFNSTLIAPSGGVIAATGPSLSDSSPPGSFPFDRTSGVGRDVWLVDVDSGSVRQIYCTVDPCPAGLRAGGHVVQLVSWSPDERYLLVREPSVASGEDFDGRTFFILDTQTGTLADLGVGQNFLSWRTWMGPHALAYVVGLGHETPKVLRTWSPERGIQDVTDASGVAVSPSFGVIDSLVYFVMDGHLATFDPDTKAIRRFTSDVAWADEAVRVSDDGKDLLVLRRRIADGQLALWLLSRDAAIAHELVRFTPPLSPEEASRYGTYPPGYTFDQLAWSR